MKNRGINNEIYRKINNMGKVIATKELNEVVDKTIILELSTKPWQRNTF
jgi:hypothetical protein